MLSLSHKNQCNIPSCTISLVIVLGVFLMPKTCLAESERIDQTTLKTVQKELPSPNKEKELLNLDSFLKNTQHGKSRFTQVVTRPAKHSNGNATTPPVQTSKTQNSSGIFEFVRPNRFKFTYTQPFAHTMVADGKTLWLYDVDLNQVTAHKQNDALASTPAALIATAKNTQEIEKEFKLQVENGWIVAYPKNLDAPLEKIRLLLLNEKLQQLEIVDKFGQRSVLTFDAFDVAIPTVRIKHKNKKSDPFFFEIPKGVEVIYNHQ